MLVTKYEMHLLDLWHSDNVNIFCLTVQYNPYKSECMIDFQQFLIYYLKITADSIQILVFPFD